MTARSWPLVCVFMVFVAACGSEDSSLVESPAPAPGPRAEIAIRVEAGRVWLACDDASRPLVIGRLSEEAGFTLIVTESPAGRVTVDLRDVPVSEALSVLLHDVPFAVEYADERSHGHRVAQVRVGLPPVAAAGPAPSEHGSLSVAPPRSDAHPPSGSTGVAMGDLGDEELERRLTSGDSRERAAAVGELMADGEELTWLVSLATGDPDPAVRIAALAELEGEESYAALRTLIRALDDPDPAVVMRALEAIAFQGDSTLRAEIEPLANHRDADVRAALAETLEELER